ncbi:MAG: DUF5106 domain-containing protein [Alistipes sp.]|nr:DUF5106 domain-containing protein [Alistipes sp.]
MRQIISILLLLLLVGCGGGGRKAKTTESIESITKELSHAELLQQRVDHFWNGFDFEDTEALKELNREQLVYAISEYVSIIPAESADSLMRALIRRASTSHDMLDYFATVCEIVLHNPNSPLRNDEYYIPVLEELLASPLLDEYERIAPAYDLEIALKNRIGRVATDFVYTLEDGSEHRLYDIKANYTILMFSNPECPLCGDIMRQIDSSDFLSVLMQNGVLEVLTLYPDEDIAHWHKYLEDIPSEWIRAYDKGQVLTKERLYNLSAIPALYLLDRDKRVLIKDGTSVADIENLLMCI